MRYTLSTWYTIVNDFNEYCEALIAIEEQWQAGSAHVCVDDFLDIRTLEQIRLDLVWIADRVDRLLRLHRKQGKKRDEWNDDEKKQVRTYLAPMRDLLREIEEDAAAVYGSHWRTTYLGGCLSMGAWILKDWTTKAS